MNRSGQKKGRSATGLKRPQQPVAPRRFGLTRKQWILAGSAFVVLVTALTREPARELLQAEEIDTSKPADQEIRASFYFETVDLEATKQAREAAMGEVPDYYRVYRERVQHQLNRLRERIARVNAQRDTVQQAVLEALRASTSDATTEDVVWKAVQGAAEKLKQQTGWEDMPAAPILATWLKPDLDSLPERVFEKPAEAPAATGQKPAAETPAAPQPAVALEPAEAEPFRYSTADALTDLSLEALEYVLTRGVRPEAGEADKPIVILRDAAVGGLQISNETTLAETPTVEEAAEGLSTRLLETAKKAARGAESTSKWAALHEAALAMARPAVSDTVQYDRVFTAGARARAGARVAPTMKEVEAGLIIQERGKRWTAQSHSDVKTYLNLLQSDREPFQKVLTNGVANAILVALTLLCLFKAMGVLTGGGDEDRSNELSLALLLMCGTLVLGRLVSYFEPTGFIIPVAATGILFAILVNVRLAAMVTTLTAVLVSIQYGYDWRLLIVSAAMGLTGAFGIFHVRRRSDMAGASIKATATGMAAMVAILLATDALFNQTALNRLMLIACNGGICLLAVPGMLSPLERLFGITTDIQLLEYSDRNNEVLSRLAIDAPATYAHSQMLGDLAEAAADAIGANGLLARVCAYYHDIGKMERSKYYSENQQGSNVHDKMPPRMSARVIAAHVVRGAELAREYHSPKPIIGGILEHHGTCFIGYFYQQALEQQKHGDVREEDFRYPGPKPQRPETAILMICDATESGVRSIKNPNRERVREFVDKIIANRSADRQFDDCNLTLKQLDTIAEVVSRRVMTSLHTRVSYDRAEEEKGAENVIYIQGTPK